jgi:predicted Zn-dependent protease
MEETRKLLKLFGVAVTDAEAEAEQLAARAAQLSAQSSATELATLLKDAADLCLELQVRWLEVTQRVAQIQEKLYRELSRGAQRMLGSPGPQG